MEVLIRARLVEDDSLARSPQNILQHAPDPGRLPSRPARCNARVWNRRWASSRTAGSRLVEDILNGILLRGRISQ